MAPHLYRKDDDGGAAFARYDSVEAAWRVVDPIISNVTPIIYEPGAPWGPVEADTIIAPAPTAGTTLSDQRWSVALRLATRATHR